MWRLLKSAVLAFIEDEGLSRGAAIAFYTVNSIPPILLIVVAIAGLVFGRDATQGAITVQLGSLVHGFRSTFKGWANEYTAHPNHISEAALANVVGDAS